ncbi:VOC family protein [Paraburkholderia sp.]|uniref:VOC family protein n=1 Tax=Paraburkholderia sp. TaxID=1926495 RepID=UPI0039E366AA
MTRPSIGGIHHLKFTVSDLDSSLKFYERALGARRLRELDHRRPDGELFAYILEIDGLGAYLEIRLLPTSAKAEAGRDHLTLTVDTRDELEAWRQHFEDVSVPHSPLLTGIVGWLLVVEDPDHRRIRFYTRETHAFGEGVSSDPYWLGTEHESQKAS